MKYIVEYTLPGERGKIHKSSYGTKEARDTKIAEIKRKGGNVKSVSSHG